MGLGTKQERRWLSQIEWGVFIVGQGLCCSFSSAVGLITSASAEEDACRQANEAQQLVRISAEAGEWLVDMTSISCTVESVKLELVNLASKLCVMGRPKAACKYDSTICIVDSANVSL